MLRARDNGAADKHPLLARREAPHNHADQADSGGKACGFPARRGLSAAPLDCGKRRAEAKMLHKRFKVFIAIRRAIARWSLELSVPNPVIHTEEVPYGKSITAWRHICRYPLFFPG